jgi:hypothetical protein
MTPDREAAALRDALDLLRAGRKNDAEAFAVIQRNLDYPADTAGILAAMLVAAIGEAEADGTPGLANAWAAMIRDG